MGKTKFIIMGIVLALVILGLGFWYWQNQKIRPLSAPVSASGGLGAKIFEQSQNPIKNVLPQNPFSNYKNPFTQ